MQTDIKAFFLNISTGPVSDALELLGLRNWMDNIYPVEPEKKVFGPAFTLRGSPYLGPGSGQVSYKMPDLVHEWNPGDIVVTQGSVGSINAGIARNYGAGGIVCEGKCRDYLELCQLSIPLFCPGPKIRLDRTSVMLDAYNVTIHMANAVVNPGDYIFGDADGVLVIPKDRLQDVIYQTQMVLEVEQELAQAVENNLPVEQIKKIVQKKRIKRT